MSRLVQPEASPTEVRTELLRRVMKDLLGPVGGPEEEVAERSVHDRYLVGVIAPRRQEVRLEEQDELAEGGRDDPEEGRTEGTAPPPRTMFPASIGMTFCVDRAASEFQVTANWGSYSRAKSERLTTDTGDPQTVWKRTPCGGVSEPIGLEPGGFQLSPDEHTPEVVVRGIIRDQDDHWSVSVFLVNGQEEGRPKDAFWLFQPKLMVESPDGEAIFHRRPSRRTQGDTEELTYVDEQDMAMLYKRNVEFAIGHGIAVHAETPEGVTDRAERMWTEVAPEYEVPIATTPTGADIPLLSDCCLDMRELAETATPDLDANLRPLVDAYAAWIDGQETALDGPEMSDHQEAGKRSIEHCRGALERIEEGLELLQMDEQAADAFRFANRAMWQQRVRSIYSQHVRRGEDVGLEEIDVPRNRSWRPFQLAFILLNLPGITQLDHPERSDDPSAVADLLWFPTGGGKTEAYLGLAAYTMGLRRLQGTVAGRSGDAGVAVLMRYTLRLLTIQQFQRAAALLCACEAIRKEALAEGDDRWGQEPFRLGLWVGRRTTPNTTEQSARAIAKDHGQGGAGALLGGIGSPAQLTNCPWCGTRINAGRDIKVESYKKGRGLTVIYCGDSLGRCPFTPRQSGGEGLPVLVVDEEIYRRLPTMLIATVDKFAQMPWKGAVQMLFGHVDGRCGRHGFRSPEIEDADSHPSKGGLAAARTEPCGPLRPPDLIIQDELHLISGPLGTMVGLYETAIDELCSWEVDGRTVRPKVIASTATIRRSLEQVHATFLRTVSVFPPHGLDVTDNFFSLQREPTDENPGRLYLGICAPGRRLKVALIRVYVAFLSAAQQLYEEHQYGGATDPWMKLVGYFNSMRELGGMRRLVEDDIRTRLGKMDQRGLARRNIYNVDELTSRKGSTEIPDVLDHMEVPFDPEIDKARKQKGRPSKDLPQRPIDVLLATNMVSVGVDVGRLGLMVVAGQPKTTAEYIQATSRVGRSSPGIVCTVYNWVRPRDLSHYESFEHYHSSFYRHVEALSVTSFSPGAISRGLTALLVSCIRQSGTEFNANDGAGRIEHGHPYIDAAVDTIARRSHAVGRGVEVEQFVRGELNERVDEWLAESQRLDGGRRLGYDEARDGVTVPLLSRPSLDPWDDFTCLNSLRDVEPSVGLILDDGGLDDPSGVPAAAETPDDGGETE